VDYIVWGILVALGMFTTLIFIHLKFTGNFFLAFWVAVMAAGWGFPLIQHQRGRSVARVRTLAGSMLSCRWLACGVVIMLFLFVGGPLLKQMHPSPAIASVLGIGFLVSGNLLDFTYFKVSAICWWIGAVAMMWLNSPTVLAQHSYKHGDILLFGIMMIVLQVVPGVILYRRWRKNIPEE
jgi:hypothetical protein